MPETRTCPCGQTFTVPYPSRPTRTCSLSCGAVYRRDTPAVQQVRRVGLDAARRAYTTRLAARLRTLSKGEVWRTAYHNGYEA